MLRRRLSQRGGGAISDPLERGWEGALVDDPDDPGSQVMEISRTLRGVTERYQLSRRLLATEEARLDEMAGYLQQYYASLRSLLPAMRGADHRPVQPCRDCFPAGT